LRLGQPIRPLRTANLIIAFIVTTGPIAHVLEMISKLTLDGPLWLEIQQHLYRGWGGACSRRLILLQLA